MSKAIEIQVLPHVSDQKKVQMLAHYIASYNDSFMGFVEFKAGKFRFNSNNHNLDNSVFDWLNAGDVVIEGIQEINAWIHLPLSWGGEKHHSVDPIEATEDTESFDGYDVLNKDFHAHKVDENGYLVRLTNKNIDELLSLYNNNIVIKPDLSIYNKEENE